MFCFRTKVLVYQASDRGEQLLSCFPPFVYLQFKEQVCATLGI